MSSGRESAKKEEAHSHGAGRLSSGAQELTVEVLPRFLLDPLLNLLQQAHAAFRNVFGRRDESARSRGGGRQRRIALTRTRVRDRLRGLGRSRRFRRGRRGMGAIVSRSRCGSRRVGLVVIRCRGLGLDRLRTSSSSSRGRGREVRIVRRRGSSSFARERMRRFARSRRFRGCVCVVTGGRVPNGRGFDGRGRVLRRRRGLVRLSRTGDWCMRNRYQLKSAREEIKKKSQSSRLRREISSSERLLSFMRRLTLRDPPPRRRSSCSTVDENFRARFSWNGAAIETSSLAPGVDDDTTASAGVDASARRETATTTRVWDMTRGGGVAFVCARS